MIATNWYPSAKQLRQFAVISLFGFGLIGAIARYRFDLQTTPFLFWGLAVLTCLVGLAAPRAILVIYALMMCIAAPIGWLVSNLVLRIMFYLIVTPLGLFFKLIGRDPLKLRRSGGMTSYWQKRVGQTDVAKYFRQS